MDLPIRLRTPEDDGWIKSTGVQPVGDRVKVDVMCRDGFVLIGGQPANTWKWEFRNNRHDITHWRPADAFAREAWLNLSQ